MTDRGLDTLIRGVEEAYKKSTGEYPQFTGDIDNPYIVKLQIMLCEEPFSFKNSLGCGTLIKILVKRDENVRPKTINSLTAYVKHVLGLDWIEKVKLLKEQELEGVGSRNSEYPGAELINQNFFERIKIQKYTPTDFYLGRNDGMSQWFGVLMNWIYKPMLFQKLRIAILKNSCITGLIGFSGAGKSIVMRSIALDFYLHFETIWITDLRIFFDHIKSRKFHDAKNYLFMVDEWALAKSSLEMNRSFFNYVISLDNVKLVICDNDFIDLEYPDYINPSNAFPIGFYDNKRILRKVYKLIPEWATVGSKLLSEIGQGHRPVFLCIYAVAYHYYRNIDEDFLEGHIGKQYFEKIISDDMRSIYESDYKGISLALCYWAGIYTKIKRSITFDAFIKVADHYNPQKGIILSRVGIERFNARNPVIAVLVRYLRSTNVPILDFSVLDFLDDTFVEMLAQPFAKGLFFDETIILEFLDVLLAKGEISSAAEMYDAFANSEHQIFHNIKQEKSYVDRIGQALSISEQIHFDNLLSDFISELHEEAGFDAQKISPEKLIEIISFIGTRNSDEIRIYMKMLQEDGTVKYDKHIDIRDRKSVIDLILAPLICGSFKRMTIKGRNIYHKLINTISAPREIRKVNLTKW